MFRNADTRQARCDDIDERCPKETCGDDDEETITVTETDLIAYSRNKAPDANYPMINFCPSFFQKNSLKDAMAFGNGQGGNKANTLSTMIIGVSPRSLKLEIITFTLHIIAQTV